MSIQTTFMGKTADQIKEHGLSDYSIVFENQYLIEIHHIKTGQILLVSKGFYVPEGSMSCLGCPNSPNVLFSHIKYIQVPRVPFFTFLDWLSRNSSLLFHHYRRVGSSL